MFENSEGWVVLKFGGTSVSSVANWHNIAGVLRDRMAANFRPVVVHSAMSGVTDRLEALLAAAIAGGHLAVLEQITDENDTHEKWQEVYRNIDAGRPHRPFRRSSRRCE